MELSRKLPAKGQQQQHKRQHSLLTSFIAKRPSVAASFPTHVSRVPCSSMMDHSTGTPFSQRIGTIMEFKQRAILEDAKQSYTRRKFGPQFLDLLVGMLCDLHRDCSSLNLPAKVSRSPGIGHKVLIAAPRFP
jgi:hypothetical protein